MIRVNFDIQNTTETTKTKALEMENISNDNDTNLYMVDHNAEYLHWNPVPMNRHQADKKPPSELNCSVRSLPRTFAESFPADNFGKGALPDIDSDDKVFSWIIY